MERAFQVGRSTRRYRARRRCRASDRKATRATRSSAATASAVCSTSTSRSAPGRTALSCLPWTVSTSLRSPGQRTRRRSRRSSPLPSSESQWNPPLGTRSRAYPCQVRRHLVSRAHVNKHEGTRRQDCRGLEGRRGVGGAPRVYPVVLSRTVRLAKEYRVGIGAHFGFPDVLGFGRRHTELFPPEVKDYVVYQLGTVASSLGRINAPAPEASPRVLHGVRGVSGLAQALCEAIAEQVHDIALRLMRDKTVRTRGGRERLTAGDAQLGAPSV
jgi:hypothetical protein